MSLWYFGKSHVEGVRRISAQRVGCLQSVADVFVGLDNEVEACNAFRYLKGCFLRVPLGQRSSSQARSEERRLALLRHFMQAYRILP